MPTDTKVEVTLGLSDGTKIVRIENLADVTTFLEQHEEFVKAVRCKDCKHSYLNKYGRFCYTFADELEPVKDNDFCSRGKRKDEVEE